jgi:glycosyltransferase involved in cell wall biosynthesis
MVAKGSGAGPDVSVVVATYNREARLRALLDALRAQTLDADRFEIVVVNDGSADGTAELLKQAVALPGPALQVVNRPQNGGRATARQDGWRTASAPLIAFTDDDCLPDPGWLEAGLRAADEHPGAIVQGRTQANAAELEAITPSRRAFARTIRVDALDPTFQTCNLFYPRELLEQVGGFDVDSFGRVHGGEDSDLAWRAIEAGASAHFAPEALVTHAVADLGPLGKLRVAAGWEVLAVARHSELRARLFERGIFWKGSHRLLVRALLGLALPRRLWPLRLWLALPYLRHLRQRGEVEGGGLAMAPYYAVYDLVETTAVARGAIRHRTPML